MKPNLPVLFLSLSIITAAVLGGWASQTSAAPRITYALYDATNTYLGDVVGITYGIKQDSEARAITYTTYLPSLHAIVQMTKTGADIQIGDILHDVYYTTEDCTGTAYLAANSTDSPWTSPWVVSTQGNTYKIDTTSTERAVESTFEGSACNSSTSTSIPVLELIPVILPFTSVTPPFTLR